MMQIDPLNTDWYHCAACKFSFFVKSDDKDIHLLKPTMRCPNHLDCKGRIRYRTKWPESGRIPGSAMSLSAEALFQATAGIGLPNERKCSPAEMKKLLTGARIKTAHIEKSNDPHKAVLLSLTLEGGQVIHLSTSTKGPLIYKVGHVG